MADHANKATGAEASASATSSSAPVKKVSKTSKLAKMNEAERAKYLEKKMAEEEETKRRKEEMVNGFLKMKMRQEQQQFTVNSSKLIDQWRTILRQCKNAELHAEVKTLSESFSKALDRKGSHITMLMQELSEAEDQYNLAFRSQRELIDCLNSIHRKRLEEVLAVHDNFAAGMQKKSFEEKEKAEKSHLESMKYLGDVIIATDQQHDNLCEEIRNAYHEIRDEYRNKTLEEKQAVQINLDEQVEKLWQQMQTMVVQHKSGTEEKRRIYYDLTAKDEKGLAEVVENNKRIAKLTDETLKLKDTLSDLRDIEERRLGHLRRERDELQRKLRESRRTVSIKQTKNEDKDVKRVCVLVDNLQKKVSEVESFHSKVHSLVKGCQNPLMRLLADPRFSILVSEDDKDNDETKLVVKYLSESFIHLAKLKEDKRLMKMDLQRLRSKLHNYLGDVAMRLN